MVSQDGLNVGDVLRDEFVGSEVVREQVVDRIHGGDGRWMGKKERKREDRRRVQ